MSVDELLNSYESTVGFSANLLEPDSSALGEYVSELRGAWERRAILRILRVQEGIPSAVVMGICITASSVRCMKGDHDTWPERGESC